MDSPKLTREQAINIIGEVLNCPSLKLSFQEHMIARQSLEFLITATEVGRTVPGEPPSVPVPESPCSSTEKAA